MAESTELSAQRSESQPHRAAPLTLGGHGVSGGRFSSPAATVVGVTASRGDSWFSARVGSEEGRVLDERVLAQGETVRLRGSKIWLSVGASGNLDVTVDGEPTTLPPGTVSVVLTRAGLPS